MNTMQLKIFLEAAQVENFSKAAENLFVTQPVISRNIAALEKETGIQLFVRERHSVHLSAAGKEYYEGVKKLVSEYKEVCQKAENIQKSMAGRLLIGTAEGQLLAEAYSKIFNIILSRYPNINLNASFYSLNKLKYLLLNNSIDIAITDLREIQPYLDIVDYEVIRTYPTYLVIPRSSPLCEKEDLSLLDLSGIDFITLGSQESQVILNAHDKQALMGADVNFKVAPDIGTLALWLESGMGFSILNHWHSLRNSPNLKFVHIDGLSDVVEVAAWNRNKASETVQLFLDIAREVLQEN